jgi:hypothetical protein
MEIKKYRMKQFELLAEDHLELYIQRKINMDK